MYGAQLSALSVGTLGYVYDMWLHMQPSAEADQMPLQLFVLYLPAKTTLCMTPQLTTNGFEVHQANVKRNARLIRRLRPSTLLPNFTLAKRQQQHTGQLSDRLTEQLHAAACLMRWLPAVACAVER